MEVALNEISVTPFPALVGADAMVLRSGLTHSYPMTTNHITIETQDEEPPPVKRQKLSEFLRDLEPPSGAEK
jgi:hypothetical protein